MSVRTNGAPSDGARPSGRAGVAGRPVPRVGAHRAGFSLVELLITVVVAGVLIMVAGPRWRSYRDGAAVRSARLELVAAHEAARAGAIQRGQIGRVLLSGDSLRSVVDTGPPGAPATGRMTVFGPVRLDALHQVTLTVANGADRTIAYDSRGLANPRLGRTAVYVVARGAFRDSVCVSSVGLVLLKRCAP